MNNKKRPLLWKDITIALVIKGIFFFLIWFLFFAHPASEHINTNQAYVDHLLSTKQES
jgi:hypothetical protein